MKAASTCEKSESHLCYLLNYDSEDVEWPAFFERCRSAHVVWISRREKNRQNAEWSKIFTASLKNSS